MKPKAAVRLDPDVVPAAVPGYIVARGAVPLPGRTFVRNQGCYNCMNFAGPDSKLYQSHRTARRQADVRELLERGVTLERAERRVAACDRYLALKGFGVCWAGGGQADFVEARFLCEKWKGRVRTEAKMDPTAAELKDLLGDPK